MSEPFLHATGLVASYRSGLRRKRVLQGADLSASSGTVTCLFGPNGGGKTTLLSVLLGLLRPDAGTCTIGGMSPRAYARSHGVAYLPEASVFPRGWTAQNVLARAVDLSSPPQRRAQAFEVATSRAGFDSAALAHLARKCSKGMQRSLLLACALAGDPELVVLDEPFSGLDLRARAGLRSEIEAARSRGATVLISSHELAEIRRVSDRVWVLEDGVTRQTEVCFETGGGIDEIEEEMMERGS